MNRQTYRYRTEVYTFNVLVKSKVEYYDITTITAGSLLARNKKLLVITEFIEADR